MDLYKLQAALKCLNGIYWNKRIDKALQESGYPRGTPQESAFYRHVVALRDKRAETAQALLEVKASLAPYSEDVVTILSQIATSAIPVGQLASAIGELKAFDGVSTDNYKAFIEFAVCFSHEQFLSDLKNYLNGPAETGRDAKTMIAIIISLLVACIFELSVRLVPVTPFSWLKNHPSSYGLRGAIVLLVPCIFVGLLKRQYRKRCLRTAVIPLVLLILSLLGGRTHP